MSRPDARIEAEKRRTRERAWKELSESGEALFPGARGRIPNFRGAAAAADRLAATEEWRAARTIKCNPDSPQRPVRLRALREGKTVYMAVPRLAKRKCFWELQPRRLGSARFAEAATIAGAAKHGRPVHPRDLPHIDLVVTGSVAVDRRGARVGKGGGYSDLEFAIGREFGVIDESTRVATTVHPLQIVGGPLPTTAHDFFLDLIATPRELLRPPRRRRQPSGIFPDHLPPEMRREIPVLNDL